jgi:hypothetical protein
VFSLTGYIEPATPHEDKRPGLNLPNHPELKAHVDALNQPDNLGAAKEHLPDAILDWADTIICAAYEWKWIAPQWNRIKSKRVIWRTIGQSLEPNERLMAPLFHDGLEIVRYSPKERNIPGYAGESAVIRFAKDPADFGPWVGDGPFVTNVTQHMAQRGDACGYWFWQEATQGLYSIPLGPGSESIGGVGALGYNEPAPGSLPMVSVTSTPDALKGEYDITFPNTLLDWLKHARVYLYVGTRPASYTLGLIEAMLTGVPVVSIGPRAFGGGSYLSEMFEGHEITGSGYDDPADARDELSLLLEEPLHDHAAVVRRRAIDLFGIETIAAQWASFLGKGG